MDSVLVNLMGLFHLMTNKVIMQDRENTLHYAGDFCYWINKVNTCFVILSHSISTCLCNPMTRNSPWWFNFFLSECNCFPLKSFTFMEIGILTHKANCNIVDNNYYVESRQSPQFFTVHTALFSGPYKYSLQNII